MEEKQLQNVWDPNTPVVSIEFSPVFGQYQIGVLYQGGRQSRMHVFNVQK